MNYQNITDRPEEATESNIASSGLFKDPYLIDGFDFVVVFVNCGEVFYWTREVTPENRLEGARHLEQAARFRSMFMPESELRSHFIDLLGIERGQTVLHELIQSGNIIFMKFHQVPSWLERNQHLVIS